MFYKLQVLTEKFIQRKVTSSSQSRSSLSPIRSAAKMVTPRREDGSAMAKRMLLVLGPARVATAEPRRSRPPAWMRSAGELKKKGGALKEANAERWEIGLETQNKVVIAYGICCWWWCFCFPFLYLRYFFLDVDVLLCMKIC